MLPVKRWEPDADGGDGSKWYCVWFENPNYDPKSGYSKRWPVNQRVFRQPETKDHLVRTGHLTEAEYESLLSAIPKDATI